MSSAAATSAGLSPPTRGNRCLTCSAMRGWRSIPAHAGEPVAQPARARQLGVYPRPRGGTSSSPRSPPSMRGLSPPTRGNPSIGRASRPRSRSIPAHAGEPPAIAAIGYPTKVYPRPRGGTAGLPVGYGAREGLSPPTRGNLLPSAVRPVNHGSIPAHAGEPLRGRTCAAVPRVYPRPRGGTPPGFIEAGAPGGLSPPTRGNPLALDPRLTHAGSIPAHAGEPPFMLLQPPHSRVYPRPRGGTREWERGTIMERSIPAHAGEPQYIQNSWGIVKVYPRPRGGTQSARGYSVEACGLSPPTRGNLQDEALDRARRRSIPAHAGEPGMNAAGDARRRVYPRPRGGTEYA